MPERVCLDASVALALVLEGDDRAQALWRKWIEAEADICSPPLFFAEMTSVIRRKLHNSSLNRQDGEDAFSLFETMDVRQVDPPGLQRRAWELARRFGQPTAYDCQYLAVAEHLGCELWTRDRRLAAAISEPWVRYLGTADVPRT